MLDKSLFFCCALKNQRRITSTDLTLHFLSDYRLLKMHKDYHLAGISQDFTFTVSLEMALLELSPEYQLSTFNRTDLLPTQLRDSVAVLNSILVLFCLLLCLCSLSYKLNNKIQTTFFSWLSTYYSIRFYVYY